MRLHLGNSRDPVNGSSFDALYEEWKTALTALRTAYKALCNMTPNDRDYYVQGPFAGRFARAVNESRMTRIHEVMTELEEDLAELCDQKYKQDAQRAPNKG